MSITQKFENHSKIHQFSVNSSGNIRRIDFNYTPNYCRLINDYPFELFSQGIANFRFKATHSCRWILCTSGSKCCATMYNVLHKFCKFSKFNVFVVYMNACVQTINIISNITERFTKSNFFVC